MSTLTAVLLPSRGFDPVRLADMTLDEAKEAIAILAAELAAARADNRRILATRRAYHLD